MDYALLASTLIESSIWKLMLIATVAVLISLFIKYTATVIFDYIMLKSDLIGIGTIVEYENKRYTIRDVGFRRLTLEQNHTNKNNKHEKIYVIASEWRKMHIIYEG